MAEPFHNPSLEKTRFVWPPNQLPSDKPPSGESDRSSRLDLQSRETLRTRLAVSLRRPAARAVPVLDACEDDWLDLTRASLPRRAAELEWFPDLPGDYCPRCGVTAGPDGCDSLGCEHCVGSRPPFERIIRLGSFEGLLRDCVHEVKFDASRTLGGRLGRLLGTAIAHQLDASGVDRSQVLIVPMPTTFRRRMSRGIDHALILARAARSRTGGSLVRPILKRHRPSQLDVNPSERERNMARAFRPRRIGAGLFLTGPSLAGPSLAGKVVIVIDDVTTTGATLRGACRAVLAAFRAQSGGPGSSAARPRVWAAVLGVTPGDPEPENRPSGAGATEDPSGENRDSQIAP